MSSMSSVAMRNLSRRKGRYALTALGTALGVAVLFGVLVSGGATSGALDRAEKAGAGKTDVYVGPIGTYDATLPPDADKRVAALPDVRDSIPSVSFRSSAEVLTLFSEAQRRLGQTVLMVTHDPRSAAYGDDVVLLRAGSVAGHLNLAQRCRGEARTNPAHPARSRTVLRWLEQFGDEE